MAENVTIAQLKTNEEWVLVIDDSNPSMFDIILKDGTRKKLNATQLDEDSEDLAPLTDIRITSAQRGAWEKIFPTKVDRPSQSHSTGSSFGSSAGPSANHQSHSARSPSSKGKSSHSLELDIPDVPGLVLLIRAYSGNPEWRNYWKNQFILTMETHTACWNAIIKAEHKGIRILFHDGNFPQCFAKVQNSKALAPGIYEINFHSHSEYLPERHGELEDEGGNPAFSWATLAKS